MFCEIPHKLKLKRVYIFNAAEAAVSRVKRLQIRDGNSHV